MKNKKKRPIDPQIPDVEGNLHLLLDNIPSMIGYWDKNLINRFSNKVYADYFGKSPSQIRGHHISELLGIEIYKKNAKYMKGALAGVRQTFERDIPIPAGGIKSTLADYVPHFVNGEVVGFFVIVSDITIVKNLERKNREIKAKLISASKMSSLGEMASGIAHEINNPLSIIYASAIAAVKALSKEVPDIQKAKNLIMQVEDTSLRIESIVDGLREFSREGSQDLFEEVKLEKILNQTLVLCVERFKRRGIHLSVSNTQTQLVLSCRQIQISQILLNLLNNAFDAVANTKKPRVWIVTRVQSSCLDILVCNNGPKISKHKKEKIFLPFYTTKPMGQGTGLGLSISRHLAESHGGSLFLDDKSKDTCFVLSLPLKKAEKHRQKNAGK